MNRFFVAGFIIVLAGIGLGQERTASQNFLWADKNRNGSLTKEEFVAIRALWAQRRGEKGDEKQAVRIFINKDRDKNGELTPEEFRQR